MCVGRGEILEERQVAEGKRSRFQALRDSFIIVDPQQGGYRLSIMRASIAQFLEYDTWIFWALEWGARLSGIPVPALLSLVAKELCLTDDLKQIATQIEDTVSIDDMPNSLKKEFSKSMKHLFNQAQKKMTGDNDKKDDGNNGGGGGKSDKNIHDQVNQTTGDPNDQLPPPPPQQNHQSKAALRAQWVGERPRITDEHIKMVKKLFSLVKDPEKKDVGLRRCDHRDGICAWVCEGDEPSSVSNGLSCYDLFQAEGYDCCISSLEHLLAPK